MNLKHTFTLLFFLVLSISSFAQDYKENIRNRFTQYTKHLLDQDFDKSMDYLPEAIFTIVPRTQMVEIFEQVFNNKAVEMKMISFDIKEITNTRKIDSCYYVGIKYTSVISMKYISDTTSSSDSKANRISMTKAALANTFGSDNVKVDEVTETYTISPTKKSWAISKNGQDGWKFVNVDPKQRVLMEKILPKQLIDESINN